MLPKSFLIQSLPLCVFLNVKWKMKNNEKYWLVLKKYANVLRKAPFHHCSKFAEEKVFRSDKQTNKF